MLFCPNYEPRPGQAIRDWHPLAQIENRIRLSGILLYLYMITTVQDQLAVNQPSAEH
jgi:hypothetical protein